MYVTSHPLLAPQNHYLNDIETLRPRNVLNMTLKRCNYNTLEVTVAGVSHVIGD